MSCGCSCAAILQPTTLPDPCSSGLCVGQQAQLPDGTLWELVFDPEGDCGRAWVQLVLAAGSDSPTKLPVRLATTGTIVLTGLQLIDGVMTVAGDRVLVKDQTPGGSNAANGIYLAEVGAWTRAPDFDAPGEAFPAALVAVAEGDDQHDTLWDLATDGVITIGVTPIAFRLLAPEKYEEEGVSVATRPIVNFIGPTVTVTDDPANDRVNVTVEPLALQIGDGTNPVGIDLGSDAQGDVYFRGVTGNLTRLGPGTAGMALLTGGAAADPSWNYPNTVGTSSSTRATYQGGAALDQKSLVAGDFPYAIAAGDYILFVTDTAAPRTINLPSAPPDGTTYIIKDGSFAASVNNITINRGGADTIDSTVATGATSYVIAINGGLASLVYVAALTHWVIL